MHGRFKINKKEYTCEVISQKNEFIASLKINDWQTDFFNRKFGVLNIDHEIMSLLDTKDIVYILDTLDLYAGEKGYGLIELQCNISAISMIPVFEEKGFRLVDTHITFTAFIEKPISFEFSSKTKNISFATQNDIKDILSLTHKSFTNNPFFFSRYKNLHYFTPEETERYYSAWINNYWEDGDTLFSVIKIDQRVVGYTFFSPWGFKDGEKLYKAILSAVDPEYRGQKAQLVMETFLYHHIPEDRFYLARTTQLTNFPAIKNHIRSQKKLGEIKLIFYREKS